MHATYIYAHACPHIWEGRETGGRKALPPQPNALVVREGPLARPILHANATSESGFAPRIRERAHKEIGAIYSITCKKTPAMGIDGSASRSCFSSARVLLLPPATGRTACALI
jgi:hypothetical protein